MRGKKGKKWEIKQEKELMENRLIEERKNENEGSTSK